ncbi:MAG: TIGR04222 domain-containing membrane protein [Hyphomicrobiaceae bacterium]
MDNQPGDPERSGLWARIKAFDFDGEAETELTFALRLQRSEAWTADYTQRAMLEYRRVMFLAVTHERPVSPSHAVDAVWHLHLTYTRNYWKGLCGGVLGMEVHHDPTRGGVTEAVRHREMYADTLDAYRAAFGEPPPDDVWPAVDRQFPRPKQSGWSRLEGEGPGWLKQPSVLALAFVLSLTMFSGFALASPFDVKGITFLGLLVPALILAILAGVVIRLWLRGPAARPQDRHANLDWDEAAYLAGGKERLALAAIARLAGSGVVTVDASGKLKAVDVRQAHVSPVEESVLAHLPLHPGHAEFKGTFEGVKADVGRAFALRAQHLSERGLLKSERQIRTAKFISALPLMAVILVLGLPRIYFGLSAGKPVGYLVIVLIIALVAGWFVLMPSKAADQVSDRGAAVLKNLQSRHSRSEVRKHDGPLDGERAALGVALYGSAVLAGTALAFIHDWVPRLSAAQPVSSSGCGASGCGTTSGGGDSGCSGCGGGSGD